jgi:hypothetical protein
VLPVIADHTNAHGGAWLKVLLLGRPNSRAGWSPAAQRRPGSLALSARSNMLREFDGRPGQIALHGVDNSGGIPGTAASHGCARLSTPNITWLAHHIAPGTRVTITRSATWDEDPR